MRGLTVAEVENENFEMWARGGEYLLDRLERGGCDAPEAQGGEVGEVKVGGAERREVDEPVEVVASLGVVSQLLARRGSVAS